MPLSKCFLDLSLVMTPVVVTRGLLYEGLRYPIITLNHPRQGVGAARSEARTRPMNGTPTSILWVWER